MKYVGVWTLFFCLVYFFCVAMQRRHSNDGFDIQEDVAPDVVLMREVSALPMEDDQDVAIVHDMADRMYAGLGACAYSALSAVWLAVGAESARETFSSNVRPMNAERLVRASIYICPPCCGVLASAYLALKAFSGGTHHQ
jgi:hypothetical protein